MAGNFHYVPEYVGYAPTSPGGSTTALNLNTSGTWLGFQVIGNGKTLAAVRFAISAIAGAPASGDFVAALANDIGGLPASGTNIESHTSSTPPASGAYDVSGFNTALANGVPYWVFARNANAAPATNSFSLIYGGGSTTPNVARGTNTKYGWNKAQSTTGDTGWGSVVSPCGGGVRLAFTDGTYQNLLIQQINTSPSTADAQVCSGSYVGNKFTLPANLNANAIGIEFFMSAPAGSPVGGVKFMLFDGGSNLLATTWSIASGNLGTAGYNAALFVSGGSILSVPISGTLTYRAVMANASGVDGNGAYYRSCEYTADPDANSRALLPFSGSLVKTTSQNSGSTWTDIAAGNTFYPFALLLDSNGEYNANSGGGGGGGGHGGVII